MKHIADYTRITSVEQLCEQFKLNRATLNERLTHDDVKKQNDDVDAHDDEVEQKADAKKSASRRDARRQTRENALEVVYADLKTKERHCIFKHIIMLTNSRDAKSNKTLNILNEAVKALPNDERPELHVFLADEVAYTDKGASKGGITMSDSETTFTFNDASNADTLVISRLGAIGEENCEEVVAMLQDKGFLVLNPIGASKIACNKYETALLCKDERIPQPNFTLVEKADVDDERLFAKLLRTIHPDASWDDEDACKSLEYVCKILDGHGGTGVMLLTGANIKSVLQAVFAIRPEQQMLLQRKEEADGGDIRVHVLTLRDRQVILAAMKRVKISGDFRSNVSLGATAERVRLTPEQEQIALRMARASHLPWCAVDIMPLVKDSNPSLGDNVVLEINASPGTDGITEVIGTNFINVMLNELRDSSEFVLAEKKVGYKESATLTIDGESFPDISATLDTGNGTRSCTLGVSNVEVDDDEHHVSFTLCDKHITCECTIDDVPTRIGHERGERRIHIKLDDIKIGDRHVRNAIVCIKGDRERSTQFLVNRDVLSKFGFIVSSNDMCIVSDKFTKYKFD